jgi:hypothetical protein
MEKWLKAVLRICFAKRLLLFMELVMTLRRDGYTIVVSQLRIRRANAPFGIDVKM